MPPRPSLFASTTDNRAGILQGLLIATIVICGLYFGREVLLPLALAILLSFVLTPPLLLLRRIKVPRVLAVAIVVITAFAIIGGLGWLISREATKLAADLPNYRITLSQKIASLRETTSESKVLEKAGDVLTDLQAELDQPAPEASSDGPDVGEPAHVPKREPVPVVIQQPAPTGLQLYQNIAGTLLPPLVTAGIVLLFVVFILLQREDLRDRLIRLFGASDLQRATSTMSDAASQALPLLLESGADQRGLWRVHRPGAVGHRHAEPRRLGHPRHAHALRALCGLLYRRRRPGAHRRGHRSRLDHRALGHRPVRRRRDDHGPGGRAASVRPRHRRHAHRRDRLHHLLDLAMGPPRPLDRHAHHRLPQRARPPCGGLALPQRAARRPTRLDPGGELLSARADRRRGRGHLSGRARLARPEPRKLPLHRGAGRAEAGRARCGARRFRPQPLRAHRLDRQRDAGEPGRLRAAPLVRETSRQA